MKDSILKLNTILYCKRWQETVAFYRDVLGLPITFQNDWFVEFKASPNACISIANEQRATVKSAGGQGITVAFQVNNADEVWRKLDSEKIHVGNVKNHPWGGRSFFTSDPEGNRIEIWSEN